MAKNLLIVESPAKAKTIEKILGSDFEVKSCYGHIRDLEKDEMGIDVKKGFKPRYIVPEDKEKVVKELKQIAKKSDEYGWQRMRTGKVKPSAGIYVKYWDWILLQPKESFSMKSPNLPSSLQLKNREL